MCCFVVLSWEFAAAGVASVDECMWPGGGHMEAVSNRTLHYDTKLVSTLHQPAQGILGIGMETSKNIVVWCSISTNETLQHSAVF